MITYRSTLEGIKPDHLSGFFEGWPNPPSKQAHLRILRNSDEVVIAIDDASGKVVGFVNALTDSVLSAYIPLLEVLQAYRGRGIGRELVTLMLERLSDFYMVDLLCDEELQEFYKKLGMHEARGMMMRNYPHQAGKQESDPLKALSPARSSLHDNPPSEDTQTGATEPPFPDQRIMARSNVDKDEDAPRMRPPLVGTRS